MSKPNTCQHLGDGRFRIAQPGFEVEVQLSCEVIEVLRGKVTVRGTSANSMTFDEVNNKAMDAIIGLLQGAK